MIRIGANLTSQVVRRNLERSTQNLSTASERLASGQRINRASDDAAGLAIVSTLDKDRRLTGSAIRNINDGVSMVNIISAGLNSQKEILGRMSELAAQASNGTYGLAQRDVMQKEYMALLDEFDRVADSAEFNGIKLLRNQDPVAAQLMTGITGADTSLVQVSMANSHRFSGVHAVRLNWNGDDRVSASDVLATTQYISDIVSKSSGASVTPNSLSDARGHDAALFTSRASNGESVYLGIIMQSAFTHISGATSIAGNLTQVPSIQVVAQLASGETAVAVYAYPSDGNSITVSLTFASSGATVTQSLDLSGLSFESRDPFGVSLTFNKGDAPTTPTAIGFTNLLTQNSSQRALDTVTNRIDDLSKLEGQYGAIISRLSVASSVLQSQGENFAAASSRIKDVDVAGEMAQYVRASILQQVGAALLAQANRAPAIALKLLGNQ